MTRTQTVIQTTTKLEINCPDGNTFLIGWVFIHKNPVINAVVGTFHKVIRTINTHRFHRKYK